MSTSIAELERIHLRFINVKDDLKLTEILSKILPNMINVFFEHDLTNADLQNPKIQALEQILNHLVMRVKNSQQVNPPWNLLIDIFNQDAYQNFENVNVKRHAQTRIFEFIFESYSRIPQTQDESFIMILLQTIANDDVRFLQKTKLIILLVHRFLGYLKALQMDKLALLVKSLLSDELKNSFLQMCLYFLINTIHPTSLQPSLRDSFEESIEMFSDKFRDTLKETQTVFLQNYEEVVLKFTGTQIIFTPEDQLPILLIASLSHINKTRDFAELSIRSVFPAIDTKNQDMSEKIYHLIFNETYIYRDFSEREDQHIAPFPFQHQIKLIEYLIKFECSASQMHMIRFNNLSNEETVSFLKQTLLKILNDGSFTEDTQSMSIQVMADMGVKNYAAINDDIDVAIDTFQRLRGRINELENDGNLSIRNDYAATNYIEALNKFRDCYERNLNDNNKRNLLEQYVLNYLNKEGMRCNSEIVYLLYLYLSRLDRGSLISSVLLYSIILKDHQDIKIKNEAFHQLNKFNKDFETLKNKRILRPFLRDIESYLSRNKMDVICNSSEDGLKEFLTFAGVQFNQDIIERLLEITQYAIKFYQAEQQDKENLMDLEDQQEVQEKIERLLTMNINQNFTLVKSDFSQPLNMIFEYLKNSKAMGVLRTIGLELIYKLSIGSVNLSQRVLSMKIIIKVLKSLSEDQDYISRFMKVLEDQNSTKDKSFDKLSHEVKLNTIFSVTVQLLFRNQEDNVGEELRKSMNDIVDKILLEQSLSPNIMELMKFTSVCLKKLGQVYDLENEVLEREKIDKINASLIDKIKRSDIDIVFRKYLHMYASEGQIVIYAEDLTARVFKPLGGDITLIYKRNCTTFLYQVIELYGQKSKAIQERFLTYQRVFIKFLFDRKTSMQDLSSKALSKIYNLGNSDVRVRLVESLSKTLSGEKTINEHQEKDENNELLLEFQDNTSTEQREKLKTYKDLCNIAVDLGHRELIYQFLEVHRHMAHYEDIKNAAKGLSSIIMLDEKLKSDLMKIAPKILLLTYDHNPGVKETMRDLWSNLIEVEKEDEIIIKRWPEIFKEAYSGLHSKEYRKRQSSALALSDFMSKMEWPLIKDKFKDLFLNSLALLDDDKDTVKAAAFQLVKTLRRISLRLGNIYTNSNVKELEEFLQIIIPMLLDEGIKSNMKQVRFFSVDLLTEIIKTTQNNSMMTKLKIQNKHERQLVFNYNSEQKMKEIMNKFLDRIILEFMRNLSTMNEAVSYINMIEQMAIGQGISTSGKQKGTSGFSESELTDLRIKFTKESSWGEVLKICRELLTEETFNKILNDIIALMRGGHDTTTKSAAITFVQDIILENKTHLITPQNSRKIAQKMVEIYQMNSVTTCLQIPDSLKSLYAQCLGVQMKIIKEFPKTIDQLIESVVALPQELDFVVILNIYEIIKNIPEQMLKSDQGKIIAKAIPVIYINRYKNSDYGMKTLSRKTYQYLQDHISNLTESHSDSIFGIIKTRFESMQYEDRVSASQAMQDMVIKLSDDDLRNNTTVDEIMQMLQKQIAGKHFNDKETVVEGFMQLLKLNKKYLNDVDYINQYVETCIQQIEKYSQSQLNYKNQIMKSLKQVLDMTSVVKTEKLERAFTFLISDLSIQLQKISELASMIETVDDLEEKKEDEKQALQIVVSTYELLPRIMTNQSQIQDYCELSFKYYQRTNWIIRKSVLGSLKQILEKSSKDVLDQNLNILIKNLIASIAQSGEKYETNLALISDVITTYTERYYTAVENKDGFNQDVLAIIELIVAKGQEDLKKNIDIIRRNINIQ
ncbi:proteasome-associated protein ecm29 homolog [Stylonychia lemnae]|uniref:Proteasome-associated protein ecm29 homolog n=1 Tax=Stylonychia lemnae TaxID=5949 RepID=A0A078AIN5_STYLE|nr:proteasome-associated protein ecm29 homolog [Stylonychia lemnae]|eukprot:CDW80673.1 proteasome-associated protein ecm29 homolog [Stylonychia lemnae]